jgi:hypothetical protein
LKSVCGALIAVLLCCTGAGKLVSADGAVVAVDRAGNSSAASSAVTVTVVADPNLC